jgi:hypothetical protein
MFHNTNFRLTPPRTWNYSIIQVVLDTQQRARPDRPQRELRQAKVSNYSEIVIVQGPFEFKSSQ